MGVSTAVGGTATSSKSSIFPIRVSADSRSFVTAAGAPFLAVGAGDAQALAVQLPSDALQYLQIRQAQGFNTLWVHVIDNDQDSGYAQGKTADGIAPFTGTLDGTTVNGGPNYDLTTPNEAYFRRLDYILSMCRDMGFWVHLDNLDNDSFMQVYRNNGDTKMTTFGTFLANRYKGLNNIVWMTGNDYQTWNTSPTDNQLGVDMLAAVAAADPSKLQTVELNFNMSGGLDNSAFAPYESMANAYSYYPSYYQVLQEYNSGVKTVPTYFLETYYDGITYGSLTPDTPTNLMLRKALYWTTTCGGLGGCFYGTLGYNFPTGWAATIQGLSSAKHVGLWSRFVTSFGNWPALVPDQSNVFLTAGMGTPSGNGAGNMQTDAYATAALTPDGSLGLAYCPASSTITIALSAMRGTTVARWFDPANGSFSAVSGSPFANSGTHSFATPSNNSAGDPDWVLVLTA